MNSDNKCNTTAKCKSFGNPILMISLQCLTSPHSPWEILFSLEFFSFKMEIFSKHSPEPSTFWILYSVSDAGDTRDVGLIPGSGRSPGVGNGNPLQYSCRDNPMDRGAWPATVCGATKRQTRLSNWAHVFQFFLFLGFQLLPLIEETGKKEKEKIFTWYLKLSKHLELENKNLSFKDFIS